MCLGSERLEQVLTLWEDACFTMNVVTQARTAFENEDQLPLEGPLVHWSEFRRYLLTTHASTFDFDRFVGPPVLRQKCLGPLTYVPLALASWSRFSRRIYRLTEEINMLLELGSFDTISSSDVMLPFESFGVALATPIVHEDDSYDFILVSKPQNLDGGGDAKLAELRLCSSSLGGRKPLGEHKRNLMLQTLAAKRWSTLDAMVKPIAEEVNAKKYTQCVYISADLKSVPVDDDVSRIEEQILGGTIRLDLGQCPHLDAASRVVTGLCLYLETLPCKRSRHSAKSDWRKLQSPHLNSVALSEHQIFEVTSRYKLSLAEREGLRRIYRSGPSRQPCMHWRIAHKRRPPGQGHLPVPKSVKVSPALVNRAQLLAGTLPTGCEASV